MLKNYLKTSVRNLLRYKSYSIINIFGLTIGLATTLFIFLWVMDEMSYDQFHVKRDRIFRVMSNYIYPDGKIETYGATTAMLADAMRAELPELDEVTQATWNADLLIKHNNTSFTETGFYAHSGLFSIFSFPIVSGNAANPLPNPKSIAISRKVARKFFGSEDPIGKALQVNHTNDFTITSVFADVPENSTLQFDFVISFSVWEKENPWARHWKSGGLQTLATLKPGASLEVANEKVRDLVKRNCDDCTNYPSLFQFSRLRLHGEFENGKSAGGRIELVVLFSLVAGIILLIACINFMNLATARSATRSREVGVRKSVGAQQSGLIVQFITESVLLSFFAMLLAMVAVQLLLPLFNEITNKSIQLDLGDPSFVSGMAIITLICGLLAGSYPAFFLSSFRPAIVLKGNTPSSHSGGGLRKALVVIQFVASMIFIVGSLVLRNQIDFITNKNLGFDKENVIVIDQHEGVIRNRTSFINDLMQFPAIKNIGFGGSELSTIPITTHDPKWPGKLDDSSISFKIFRCDQGFIPTLGMEILAGRNFSDLNNQDSSNYIVNKKAMEAMGLTIENVIGTDLEMWNGKGKIIGLTNDFNNGNLREAIQPLIFMYSINNGWYYFIKTDSKAKTSETLNHIERTLKKYEPDYPFQYAFLNEVFDRQYHTEAVIGKLTFSFTVVAILISCLGLLGLASFTAERRMKELGVRKVLGASAINLIILLCNDFAKLVVIALLISVPIAWYLTNDYLNGYAFHTELNVLDFALPALGIALLTLLTVGHQSLKAVMGNPADSLRSE